MIIKADKTKTLIWLTILQKFLVNTLNIPKSRDRPQILLKFSGIATNNHVQHI